MAVQQFSKHRAVKPDKGSGSKMSYSTQLYDYFCSTNNIENSIGILLKHLLDKML